MKFKALPVTSLEDATVDFEQIQPFLSQTLTLVSGQLQLDHGTGMFTWPGAVASTSTTINHGLGRVPQQAWAVAWANPSDGGGAVTFVTVDHAVFSSTQVRFSGTRFNGSPGAGVTDSFDWFVLG